MKYSPSTGFFYSPLQNCPDDAVSLTDAEYQSAVSAISKGGRLLAEGSAVSIVEPAQYFPVAADLCQQIDAAADMARAKVVADPVRAMEYQLAAAEAQAFKDAGYPSGAVPRAVSAYAIKGRTPQEAADSILAEAAAYNEALYSLREIRLSAKAEIHDLFTIDAPEQAKTLADSIVAHINSLVAGVGNAATGQTEDTGV